MSSPSGASIEKLWNLSTFVPAPSLDTLLDVRMISPLLLVAVALGATGNLYSLLGVARKASVADIKRAYRDRALETHPDKNKDLEQTVAAEEFRSISLAYEVLSDPQAREFYDKTGQIRDPAQSNNPHGGVQSQVSPDKLLKHPDRRQEILDAQSRVLRVRSIAHLKAVAADENGVLEKVLLLAFYSSSDKGDLCKQVLDRRVLFPYPFAGFNRRDGEGGSLHWQDAVLPAEVDLAHKGSNPAIGALAAYFGIAGSKCPTIAFVAKGALLDSPPEGEVSELTRDTTGTIFDLRGGVRTHSDFETWIFQKLKIDLHFTNRAPYTVKWWYVPPTGKPERQVKDILSGEGSNVATFVSHVFIFQAVDVEGLKVNNQSAVLSHRVSLDDKGATVPIRVRCHDRHSECVRWKSEGFCDAGRESKATRDYPGQRRWTLEHCPISCEGFVGAEACEAQLTTLEAKAAAVAQLAKGGAAAVATAAAGPQSAQSHEEL